MADLEAMIDACAACGRVMEAEARIAQMWQVLSEEAYYADPSTELSGIAAFAEHIGKVPVARSGARILRSSAVDLYHGLARFGWHTQAVTRPGLGQQVKVAADPALENHDRRRAERELTGQIAVGLATARRGAIGPDGPGAPLGRRRDHHDVVDLAAEL